MRIGLITAPRRISWTEVAEPTCGPGEVKVRLRWGCLCGSDSPFFKYDFNQLKREDRTVLRQRLDYDRDDLYPLPVGMSLHECVGQVVESRANDSRLRPGDWALARPPLMDGLAEILVLPESQVMTLPATDVSLEEMLLCQPLGTVRYALRNLPEVAGRTIAVVGQGPMGQLINAELARRGAKRVVAVDRQTERLAMAKRMGATDTLAVSSSTLDHGGFVDGVDLAIEVVGHDELAVDLCADLARFEGRILIFGAVDSPRVDAYPLGVILRKNLTVHHSIGANDNAWFQAAARSIANREINVSPIITHRFPWLQAQTAFETFVDRKDGALKVLLDFHIDL